MSSPRARGVLAALRALGPAGWQVAVGTPDGDGMVAASRWCHRVHRVPRPRGDGVDFVAAVATAVRDGGYSVVFGGADDWMAGLAAYRDSIPTTVAHPAFDVVARGLDKLALVRDAAGVGMAVPRTESADDEAVARWQGPVVVKCRSHWHPGQHQQLRLEARRFPDVERAAGRIAELRRQGFEPLLQQPLDGDLVALVGLVDRGRLVGRVQQVASGTWPTPSGVSSHARTVPVDPALAARAQELLRELDWSGLVELQFLRPAGGRPHLIDLNGRFYGSMALAVAAGPNLPDAWARQVLGLDLPDLPDGVTGMSYQWTAGDLRRAWHERRGGLVADMGATIRRRLVERPASSVWDRRDPGPILHVASSRLRRGVADDDRLR